MFEHWKEKLVTFGSVLLALITWLAFFGIDARTLRDQMTAHYLFLILAILFTAAAGWGWHSWRKAYRITPENIRAKIREWLDLFNYSYAVFEHEPWHWTFHLNIPNSPPIFVGRSKRHGDSLQFTTHFAPMTSQQRLKFNAMSSEDSEKFARQLNLETAKAKVSFWVHGDLQSVSIEKSIPITSSIVSTNMVEGISEIFFSATIITNTIALYLGGKPEITEPKQLSRSSNPSTEGLPTGPTS